MSREVVFMIVYISDLHFAEELYPSWTRSGTLASKTPPLRARLSLFQGVFPHDVGACEELENEIKALIRSRKPLNSLLVVSGDLTWTGDDSEFVMALTYLRGRLQRYWTGRLGLSPWIKETYAVPGNHDQWNSSRLRGIINPGGRISPIHGIFFRGPSGQSWWHSSLVQNDVQLQLMGIDLCEPARLTLFARGYIDKASLTALDQEISKADTSAQKNSLRPVRVLVVHHSPEYTGGLRWFKEIEPTSLGDLKQFCKTHDIHFVLTGHVHKEFVPAPGTLHAAGTELRCGTTLQGAPRGKVPNPSGNVFLVHLLFTDGSLVEWQTRVYQRAKQGPFTEAKSQRYAVTLHP
jgi:hypothetical protein